VVAVADLAVIMILRMSLSSQNRPFGRSASLVRARRRVRVHRSSSWNPVSESEILFQVEAKRLTKRQTRLARPGGRPRANHETVTDIPDLGGDVVYSLPHD
jgi:hypothetical protein